MRRDDAYLLDMLIAARDAIRFMEESGPDSVESNKLHRYAILKAIEIVGEASARVSVEFKQQHPDLPWRLMAAMRNRLVHGYFEIDLQVVRRTLSEHLPRLIALIEPLVPPEDR